MYAFINAVVKALKRIVPNAVVRPLLPLYHKCLAFTMALAYGFPARKLVVIGVTGTKGKSTVTEMLFTILRKAGHKTALLSTIRFAINDDSEPNLYKMTLPGRGFVQAFMKKAVETDCKYIVIELTSEAQLQYRTSYLALDGLIVTNIQREHIERHGSFENYITAKREIVAELEHSPKKKRVLVTNSDNEWTKEFLKARVTKSIGFSEADVSNLLSDDNHVEFVYNETSFSLPLPGKFNALNALPAIMIAEEFGILADDSSHALSFLSVVHGRVERIDAGQDFIAVVDYAHTPDSLSALYNAFSNKRKICVLGNTGGGRDAWKRPEMGKIADDNCETVILTNEDPYDEDPRAIVDAMARGMKRGPQIIMDRREAVRAALRLALSWSKGAESLDIARDARNQNIAVLISGKGTDPYIMGPNDSKEPWDDARVVREELEELLSKS